MAVSEAPASVSPKVAHARVGPLPSMWGSRWWFAVALATAILPTLIIGESETRLVVGVILCAAVCFAVGEWIAERGRTSERALSAHPELVRSLLAVMITVSAVGLVVALATNALSIQAVYEGYTYRALNTFSRASLSLNGPTVALIAFAYYHKLISARVSWLACSGLVISLLLVSVRAGYLSPVLPAVVTFLVVGSFVRLIRVRHLAVLIGVFFLAAPRLFALRDDYRVQLGGGRSSEAVGPLERFRVDTLMSDLQSASPASWLDLPDPGLLVRTTLVPRIVDPERPILDVGQQITYAMGSSGVNNSTFGNYGIVYWMYSWPGVALVALSLGLLFGLGVRRFHTVSGPLLLGAVAFPAVWQETTFPAYWSGLGQTLLLCGTVYLGVRLTLFKGTPSTESARRKRVAAPRDSGSGTDQSESPQPARSAPTAGRSAGRLEVTTSTGPKVTGSSL